MTQRIREDFVLRDHQILNPQLLSALSSAGHTQLVVLADPGLPLPTGVPVVDISLVPGIPTLAQTLRAVTNALVIEAAIAAAESQGTEIAAVMGDSLRQVPLELVSHERFKELLPNAHVIIRTGDCTPYANVALIAGVAF
jgi:D-ribose pyranase